MRMQSSSESGRVAYCLPIGITSSKTKCVWLRNGRSLQHPKQVSARAIVDATGRTILLLCSYIVCTRHSDVGGQKSGELATSVCSKGILMSKT